MIDGISGRTARRGALMTRAASRSGPMPRPEPSVPDRLRSLAWHVERLGSGRSDPEQILQAKMTISSALRAIAAEMRT